MKGKFWLSIMVVMFLSLVSTTGAPQDQTIPQAAHSAAAKAVSVPPSGRPTSVSIRQDILARKAAALVAQLKEIQRCILNASQLQTLRDFQGNINIVPQNDLTNCTSRLQDIQTQQDRLDREVAAFSMDAQAAGFSADRLARIAALQMQMQALTQTIVGGSSSQTK